MWIVDIDPSYQPSEIMLSGEPYVLRYLDEFEATLEEVPPPSPTCSTVKPAS